MLVTLEGIDKAGKTTGLQSLVSVLQDELDVTTVNQAWETDVTEEGQIIISTEPYDESWLGQKVREMISSDGEHPLAVFMVFLSDHCYHYNSVVKPALDADNIVVCDRYVDSRYAYQAHSIDEYVQGDTLSFIRELQESEWELTQEAQEWANSVDMPDHVKENTPTIGRYFYYLSQNEHLFPETISDPNELPGLFWSGETASWSKQPDFTIYLDITVEESMRRSSDEPPEEAEVFETPDYLTEARKNYLRLADTDRMMTVDANPETATSVEHSKEIVRENILDKLYTHVVD